MAKDAAIGKTEIYFFVGVAAVAFFSWALSKIPGGGIIMLGLVVLLTVGVGVGRWSKTAKPWVQSYSAFFFRHAKSAGIVAALFVVSSIISIFLWRIDVASAEAKRIALEEDAKMAIENEKQQKIEAKKKAEEEKREAERKAAEEQKLITGAAAAAERLKGELDTLDELVKKGKCEEAETKKGTITQEIELYRNLSPIPAEIGPTVSRHEEISNRLWSCRKTLTAIRDLDTYKGQAHWASVGETTSDGWRAVLDMYSNALAQITTLENVDREFSYLIPDNLNLKKERKAIDAKIKQAWKKREQAEEEEAATAVYQKLCGEKPTISPWDGEIVGLEAVIQRTAHDPDSIDVENCSTPTLTQKNCWVSTCDVRGKNAFGALVLNQKTFSFSSLGVSEIE